MRAPYSCLTLAAALLCVAGSAAAQTNPRSVPADPPESRPPSGGEVGERDGRENNPFGRDGGSTTGWQFCNRSGEARVHVVIAWQDAGRWRSSGWLPVDRGTCRAAPPLSSGQAFYYATGKEKSWTGRNPFCLTARTGRAVPGRGCGGGARQVPFRKVQLSGGTVFTNLR